MRIISFNTFLSPTMRGRFTRKKKINRVIHDWLIDGVDVIGLQELNSFTIGLLGYVYFYFQLYRFLHDQLARIIDALLVIEGYIFPLYIYDNTNELEHIVDQHNIIQLDSRQKYYIYKSVIPKRGVSAGVVTLVKYKPKLITIKTLPSDFIHKPGCICIKYQNKVIFNAHFIPNLPNNNIIYKAVNWINSKCSFDKNQIRMDNISESNSVISSMIRQSSDEIYMIGDYNISRETESNLYKKLINKFGLIDSALVPLCTEHSLYGCAAQKHQIDYILSSKQFTKSCSKLEYLFMLSDHYAIDAEY
jgi:endonuclease/exonuclease/phosphatase family metal-dependent hydrolase